MSSGVHLAAETWTAVSEMNRSYNVDVRAGAVLRWGRGRQLPPPNLSLAPQSLVTAAVCSSKTSKQVAFFGVVDFVVLVCVLRATSTGRQLFCLAPPPIFFSGTASVCGTVGGLTFCRAPLELWFMISRFDLADTPTMAILTAFAYYHCYCHVPDSESACPRSTSVRIPVDTVMSLQCWLPCRRQRRELNLSSLHVIRRQIYESVWVSINARR